MILTLKEYDNGGKIEIYQMVDKRQAISKKYALAVITLPSKVQKHW